ncbi:MAG TPA: hypothetical protein VNC61_06150 [Acidimicrobiales bacterium]|nr:hypothetical protein [Acidimicrobiales bacterium]
MRRLHPFCRFSLGALALTVSVATVTASGPAGAIGGVVTCGTVSGNRLSPAELFNCSDEAGTGGNGSIQPSGAFSGTHLATVYWSGVTTDQPFTTVIHVTTHVVKKKKTPCPATTTELKVSGRVRSDTSGVVSVGGRVSGILCETSNGSFALLSGSTFTL